MRWVYISLAIVGLVSVNVWLALLWRDQDAVVQRLRDDIVKPIAWEFTVESFDDGILGELTFERRGANGWSIASCRRAIGVLDRGIYECVLQRPLGVYVDRDKAVVAEREHDEQLRKAIEKAGRKP